jgi:NAD dependent epimerase/dehydratase family enzyme
MKIVIPGGSGQVGRILTRHFQARGHEVAILTRATPMNDWSTVLDHADVCINLAGRSVNCRYHAANRRAIFDSRIDTTRHLNRVISALANPPRVWLNASTATIYRHALDRPMDEATGELACVGHAVSKRGAGEGCGYEAPRCSARGGILGQYVEHGEQAQRRRLGLIARRSRKGVTNAGWGGEVGEPDTWNFSIDVAKSWEAAFFETPTPRTRKVAMRSAITLSPDRGGIFDVLLSLVRRGLGGRQGSGKQFVSWIHEADFARAVDLLIAHEDFTGAVNLASPNPLPNAEFLRVLRQAWGTRIGLPAPSWLIEVGTWLLRTESELVLKSRRVIPTRLLHAGFQFEFPDWPEAARDLVDRWRATRN